MVAVLSTTIMPNSVIEAAGVRGKNMRQNSRTRNQGGYVDAVVIWSSTLRQYEFGMVPMSQATWQTIIGLHEVTDGGASGFLIEDPADSICSATEGKLTLITGSTFQLYKRYTTIGGSGYKDRKITRPKSAIAVFRNGTPEVASVDYTTGIVTITSPGSDTFTWSGYFYVPVHFADDSIDWDLVAAGGRDARFLAGPSVLLQEVRE